MPSLRAIGVPENMLGWLIVITSLPLGRENVMLSQAPAPVQWLMTKLFEHLNKFVSINYDVQDERYSKFNIRSNLLDLASARVE